jgi:hypothetical protein
VITRSQYQVYTHFKLTGYLTPPPPFRTHIPHPPVPSVKPIFSSSQYGAYAELMVLFFRIITIMILLNIFIVIVMEKYDDPSFI